MGVLRLGLGLIPLLLGSHVSANGAGDAQIVMGGKEGGDNCFNACTELTNVLGTKAHHGNPPPGFVESFHCSRQREVVPACVIQPTTAQDVSTTIQVCKQYQCHFAVKSGGHAMFKGASNADGGVTIDLVNVNHIEVSEDQQTVRVGPGNRWGKVYEKLEPMGLVVVGGRVDHVGVGGFMLGGGISFMSRQYGWASDNVRNYQVVLANGSISNVNYESHPDLYWALRGGGNNFGVVTSFDLEAYPQKEVWGGQSFWIMSDYPTKHSSLQLTPSKLDFSLSSVKRIAANAVVKAFCLVGRCTTIPEFLGVLMKMATKEEPFLHLYMSFGYLPRVGVLLGSSCVVHNQPVVNPPEFQELETINYAWGVVKVDNLTSIARDVTAWNVPGGRFIYSPFTVKANLELLSKIMDFFLEASSSLVDVPGIEPSFVMQPISQIASVGREKNGGGPFGIEKSDGDLILISLSPEWKHAADDMRVQNAFTDFMERSINLAKERDLFHPFIYQNYANISQDVFGGYGEENRAKLLDIQGKYDPERVFAKLQPGFFKL